MQIDTIAPPPGPPTGIASGIFELFLIIVVITFIVYVLHRNDTSRFSEHQNTRIGMSPRTITGTLLIAALFGPAALNVYFGGFGGVFVYLFSMTWQVINFPSFDVILFGPFELTMTLLIMCLRPFFAYQVYRYYIGKTSYMRTVLTGIASELQLTVISGVIILYLLSTPFTGYIVMIAIPLPILLITGLAIMHKIPVQEPFTPWKDIEASKPWWDDESEDTIVAVPEES